MRTLKMAESPFAILQAFVANTVEFVAPYKNIIEVFLMLGLYLAYNDANIRYIMSPRRTRAARFPYLTLSYHIFAGLLLAGRYYAQRFLEPTRAVVPDRVDFILSLSHAISALLLARTTHSRLPLAKASFQAVALLELVAVMLAYPTQSPQWHLTIIKIIDWFVTFRTTAGLVRKYSLFGFPKGSADGIIHLVSAPFTLWLSEYPWGIPLYYAVLSLLMAIENLVSQRVPDK